MRLVFTAAAAAAARAKTGSPLDGSRWTKPARMERDGEEVGRSFRAGIRDN